MTKTKIDWADEVWNPVTGCTKISQGCKNCYAEAMAIRFWGSRKFTDIRLERERMQDPDHLRKPRRIFVNSVSDLFHPEVPFEYIDHVYQVMARNPQHTFIILTKRPERAIAYYSRVRDRKQSSYTNTNQLWQSGDTWRDIPIALRNLWFGVSVEDQNTADLRTPLLFQVPAAIRFLSVEPMLENINLHLQWHNDGAVDWIICGSESGKQARPFSLDWARSLRDQCQANRIPFFFKQASFHGQTPSVIVKMPILDGQVWREYPDE